MVAVSDLRARALAYLDLRFSIYEILLKAGDEVPDHELMTAASRAIHAAEAEAEAEGMALPIAWLRRATGIAGIAEDCLLLAVAAHTRPDLARLVATHPDSYG